MAGRKRASDPEAAPSTRASKATKTDPSSSPSKPKGGKRGPKATIPASIFKARALPLHVSLTHTPPSIVDETAAVAPADPGFIGSAPLLPTTFSTGSYGWRGTKRVVIELQNPEGEQEKVHVSVTINATVIGSKQAKEEEAKETEEAKEGEETKEEETKEAEADGHEQVASEP